MAAIKELLGDLSFIKNVPFKIKTYKALEEIVKENDNDRDVFLILSGQVQVCTEISDKKEKISSGLARLGEGEMFGELSLFDGEPRSAQIIAIRECEIVKLDGLALLNFMDNNPDKGYFILREIFENLVSHMRQNNIRCKTVLQLYMLENS